MNSIARWRLTGSTSYEKRARYMGSLLGHSVIASGATWCRPPIETMDERARACENLCGPAALAPDRGIDPGALNGIRAPVGSLPHPRSPPAFDFHPDRFRRHCLHERAAPVRRAADVHPHGAAEARRLALRVVGGNGL